LARAIYRLTTSLPPEERFGLSSQMRRAAVSVGSNIAEGAARKSTKEFVQYLYVASGSASELYTQLEISKGLFGNMDESLAEMQAHTERVSRMLHGLIRSLKGEADE
jgi:four helix bundle protein